jgi:hypothetical protein
MRSIYLSTVSSTGRFDLPTFDISGTSSNENTSD